LQQPRKKLFGERSNPKQHFSSLSKRAFDQRLSREFGQVFFELAIDVLSAQARVDFDALVFAFEKINDWQRFGFEDIKSLLQRFDIVVASPRVFGTS
jgi:hypothetical protein